MSSKEIKETEEIFNEDEEENEAFDENVDEAEENTSHSGEKKININELIEKGKKGVAPCGLFAFGKVLMTIFPFVRNIYWKLELGKLKRFAAKLKRKKNEEKQAVHSAE